MVSLRLWATSDRIIVHYYFLCLFLSAEEKRDMSAYFSSSMFGVLDAFCCVDLTLPLDDSLCTRCYVHLSATKEPSFYELS